MPKFTDGPWEVDNSVHGEGGGIVHIIANDGSEICVAWEDALSDKKRFGANCNLIAAAPDLYEALEKQLNNWIELIESGDAGFWDKESDEHVISMRTALAKARGD